MLPGIITPYHPARHDDHADIAAYLGTQIQGLGFDESQFRGEAFAGCACHQQGNNDLLILTQPAAIEEIHYQYAIAGADILETNTFSSTSIAVERWLGPILNYAPVQYAEAAE